MTEQMKQALDKAAKGLQWSQGSMLIDKETLQPADPAVVPLNRLVHLPIPDKLDMAAHFGANWYRNNIWHSPDEEPEHGEGFAIIDRNGILIASYNMMVGSSMSWEKIKEIDGCKCWAYCEDLMPTPGYKEFSSKIKTED
jgi:hypothetical protein